MDIKFEIGKASIPFFGEENVEVEGLKFSVENYDMKDAVEVLKVLPTVLKGLRDMEATQQEEDEDESNPLRDFMNSLNSGGGGFAEHIFKQQQAAPNVDSLFKKAGSFPNLDDLLAQQEQQEIPDALKKLLQNSGAIPIAIQVPKGVSISDVLKHFKGE